MLRSDLRQNLVLVLFAVLLFDVLTTATLVLLALGMILVFLQKRPSKLVRNLLALGIFVSYWITYGKLIDPEVGLNFLTSIIVLKILEKDTVRDRYMIFFGLLLLISAGSLFERTLTYVLFFALSFIFLIHDFYSYLGQSIRLKDLGKALLWVLPLTFLLFFFVPRMMNPLPFQQGKPSPGEIGYTPDVNISQIESLAGNSTPVFQAVLSRPVPQEVLYWRGNTLSTNDGWNWTLMLEDRSPAIHKKELSLSPGDVRQSIRVFNQSEFFFTLEMPKMISYGSSTLELTRNNTLGQNRWQWIPRYEVVSTVGATAATTDQGLEAFLRVPLPRKTKEWIWATFKGTTLAALEEELRGHFLREKFSYSLAPGPSRTFEEFFRERRIGFCSHFASAVGIVLRIKGIPTRLVSGFMGGAYNRFAGFYLVSQNDAHVWVEAFADGKWQRLDPTEWIAPDRVRLGGEAFMAAVQDGMYQRSARAFNFRFLIELKQWFAQWDFYFYTWLEEMDYYTQESWLLRFNLKRKWLYSLVPVLMLLFAGAYAWYLSVLRRKSFRTPIEELWRLFFKRLGRRGVMLSSFSLAESETVLRSSEFPNKEETIDVWNELVRKTFADEEGAPELKKRIKQL